MPQVVPTSVVQLQQQPTYWDRLLANLLALSQLGGNIWQGMQNQDNMAVQKQRADTERMYAKQQAMQTGPGMMRDPAALEAMLVEQGWTPDVARAASAAHAKRMLFEQEQEVQKIDSMRGRKLGAGPRKPAFSGPSRQEEVNPFLPRQSNNPWQDNR